MRMRYMLFAVTLLVTGCQTADDSLSVSSTPVVISGAAASAIAGDLASRLAEQLPPATTTVRMEADKSDFAVALEAAIKGWGYTVVPDAGTKDSKSIKLGYSLQGIDGQLLAQVSTPAIALGRAYTASSTGAVPASPLSIMQRN
ncbi:conjugal transfer protein TrbH [Agrobacterium sp. CG160-95]